MMWVYGVKGKKMHAIDLHSLEELKTFSKKFEWFWIDCMEPDANEFQVISEFLHHEHRILENIKDGKPFPRYKKLSDCTVLSISVIIFQRDLRIYPIYAVINEKKLLTVRNKDLSSPIEYVIQTLQDCISETEETSPSFILSELLREVANRNLDVVMKLREMIESVEEKAMAKPSRKTVVNMVFTLKRQIAMLYRLLCSEEQLMSSLKDGFIPNVKMREKCILSLEDAMDNIARELEFLNSYDSALDGVLRLQDLSMIHRVEKTLIYLTVIIVIMNVLLIALELGLFSRSRF
ncbi:MAG: CorA family divalent cation transporter [Candidatus Bathyarchaeia archaeon]